MRVAALVLVALGAGGAWADDPHDATIARIDEHRGLAVTPEQLGSARIATASFGVDAGDASFAALVDWRAGAITILPAPVPDNGAGSGCVGTRPGGWAGTPVEAPCSFIAYQSHEGGLRSQTLVCTGGSFCSVDALNLAGTHDYVLFECHPVVAAAADQISWEDQGQLTGRCDAYRFAFGAEPPDFVGYDSIVAGDGAAFAGANNV